MKTGRSPVEIFYHEVLTMPWWLAIWGCFLVFYARDYWHVPLEREGIFTMLRSLQEGFQGWPEELRARHVQLARWCDDLEDALSISRGAARLRLRCDSLG